MSDNTIIQQGRFTSTGATKTLSIRSDVDWMRVYNVTVAAASQTTAVGVEYYWQRGFPAAAMWEYKKSNAANAANLSSYATSGGFTLLDTSLSPNGPVNSTVTAISTATPPVVSNSGTNGLVAGDVVRLLNVAGAQQLGGMDFTVGIGTLTTSTFSLDFMPAIAVATTGSWLKIKYDPMFYPRRRTITSITRGTTTLVQMAVRTTYTIGQSVFFNIPAIFGMPELNNRYGTILSINTTTNSLEIDIDSSAFTAFTFPLSADVPFTPAQVCPGGEDTAEALVLNTNILGDATENRAFLGMSLAAGANSPAGSASDVIYWVAGKSFSIDNQ